MTLDTLNHLRKVTPVAIILAFTFLLGYTTNTWTMSVPTWDSIEKGGVGVIFIALVYYISPLRDRMNKQHHKRITDLLRLRLVQLSGKADNPDLYKWRTLKPMFFNLVDNDKSLTIIASKAFDNGYYWTTSADISAIALAFAGLCVFLFLLNVDGSFISVVMFILISLVGHIASIITTRKQISIGNEQIDVIHQYHLDEVKRYFNELSD